MEPDVEVQTCLICSEPIDDPKTLMKLACGCYSHYHKDCISKWLLVNNSCPTCRKKMYYIKIDNKEEEEEEEPEYDYKKFCFNCCGTFVCLGFLFTTIVYALPEFFNAVV